MRSWSSHFQADETYNISIWWFSDKTSVFKKDKSIILTRKLNQNNFKLFGYLFSYYDDIDDTLLGLIFRFKLNKKLTHMSNRKPNGLLGTKVYNWVSWPFHHLTWFLFCTPQGQTQGLNNSQNQYDGFC